MKHRATEALDRMEHSSEAGEYYICPRAEIAIPKLSGENYARLAEQTILTELAHVGDMVSPNTLEDYPVVSNKHRLLHFSEYRVIALLRHIVVTKPLECFSGHEQLAVEKARLLQLQRMAEEKSLEKEHTLRQATHPAVAI